MHGVKEIGIPQGIEDGQKIVLRGLGLPVFSNSAIYGNMFLICRLETPKKISDELKDLFSKIVIDKDSYPEYSRLMAECKNAQN